jgi:hypothetical protein
LDRIWGDKEFVIPVNDYETDGRSTSVSSSPVNLPPKTTDRFRTIKRSLDFSGPIKFDGEDSVLPFGEDNSLERLNELMR